MGDFVLSLDELRNDKECYDYLLEAIEEVQNGGQVNMFDKLGVVHVLDSYGWVNESKLIENWDSESYLVFLSQDFSEYLSQQK